MRKFLNQSGLGILEITLLIGVMTGMAYYLLMDKNRSSDIQERSNFEFEAESVATLVRMVLSDVYSCTESVKGIAPGVIAGIPIAGQPLLGEAQGGTMSLIRRGIKNPAYDPLLSGSTFSSPDVPILKQGEEVHPGVKLESIQLVYNYVDYLIRIRFQTPDRLSKKKSFNRDFVLNVKMNPTEIYECSLRIPIEHLQLGCLKLSGTWEKGYCNLDNYYLRSRNLLPVFEDDLLDYTTTPTPIGDPVFCECHMTTCGPDCCTPPSCGPNAYNEEPPRLIKSATGCKLETSCWERPVSYLFRP
jgi:hypothetical protein